jgi:hypothetical protein
MSLTLQRTREVTVIAPLAAETNRLPSALQETHSAAVLMATVVGDSAALTKGKI